MRLRLYHHRDGARVAYREAGTGAPLALLHSLGLTHREFEPVVDALAARFRVVLPDLPLHGDSEDRPAHPYSPDWFLDVLSGFCAEVLGPRALLGGHDLGATLALRAVGEGRVDATRLVLLPGPLHRRPPGRGKRAAWRRAARVGAFPVADRAVASAASLAFRPKLGDKLSAQRNPAARDLLRHAFADVSGNGNRARAWARFARRWPSGAQHDLLDLYPRITIPVLLLWADADPWHPLATAQEAFDLLPDAQLRMLSGAGFLVAYDDPVGLARELIAFGAR